MIFVVRLTPLKGVDPIRALRAALKTLRRRHGLHAISAVEEPESKTIFDSYIESQLRILAKQEPVPDGLRQSEPVDICPQKDVS